MVDIQTKSISILPEICDNAIDDDGDGTIDLNDEDCFCPLIAPELLIPNPSFEAQDCCPEQHSSAHCATSWVQASKPTPDYFHYCDWTANGSLAIPQPIPDGEGFIGFIDGVVNGDVNPDWKEYVGTCLPKPLQADSLYQFQFYMGFLDKETSPDTDIVLFGTQDCANLPFGGGDPEFGCPTNGLGWVRLGATSVFGENEWKQFKFTLKPPYNVEAVVIGPDCYYRTLSKNTYYFMDNLELAGVAQFDIKIEANDQPCSPNLAFEIRHLAGFDYQWYKNGTAILGATSNTLEQPPGAGKYQVRIRNEKGCKISEPYSHNIPYLYSKNTQTICQGDYYLFGNQELNEAGDYWDTLKTNNNCDSIIHLNLQVEHHFEKEVKTKIFPFETYKIGSVEFYKPGEYIQAIASEGGCDSIVYLILDYYRIYIPNVFSPNNDGQNDLFSIFGNEDLKAVSTLKIFDRWGNIIYEGQSLAANVEWDGKTNDNKNAPEAVYVFQAQILMEDSQTRTISGTFTLIR